MRQYEKIVAVIFVSILLIINISGSVSAGVQIDVVNPVTCQPMDVVFIVAGDTEPISWALDALSLQHFTRCQGTSDYHQVGVVSILNVGENHLESKWEEEENENQFQYVSLQLSPLNSLTFDLWKSDRTDKFTSIKDKTVVPDFSLGTTGRLKGSFAAALDQLSGSDPARKQIVVYVGYPVANPSDNGIYHNEILRQISEMVKTAKERNNSLEVYAVLTDDLSEAKGELFLQNYYEKWQLIADQVYPGRNTVNKSGEQVFFDDDWAVPQAIFEILANAGGYYDEIVPFGCQTIYIPPYQGTMEWFFFANDSAVEVNIDYDGVAGQTQATVGGSESSESDDILGLEYVAENEIIESNGITNRIVLFSDPPAGTYKITAKDNRCSDFIGYRISGQPEIKWSYSSDEIFQYNANGLSSDPENPYYLNFSFVNIFDQTPIKLYESLLPKFERSTGSGDMGFTLTEDQLGFVSQPLNVEKDELIAWSFDIKFPVDERKTYETVFTDISGDYSVRSVNNITPFVISPVLEDVEEDTVQLHGYVIPEFLKTRSVSVKVQFVKADDQNEVIGNLEEILEDPNHTLQVYLKHVESGDESDRAVLVQSEENKRVLEGEVGADISKPGKYYLRFEVLDEFSQGVDQYRMVLDAEKEYYLYREDNIFSLPILWYVIGSLILLVIFSYIGYQLSLFGNPLKGKIELFRPGGNRPYTEIRFGKRRIEVYSQKKLKRMSPLIDQIVKLTVQHAKDANGKILVMTKLENGQEKMKVMRSGDTFVVDSMLHISYMNEDEQKFSKKSNRRALDPDPGLEQEPEFELEQKSSMMDDAAPVIVDPMIEDEMFDEEYFEEDIQILEDGVDEDDPSALEDE